MTTHHQLSPSSYPAWAVCPHFTGGDANEDTRAGSNAHELLYKAFVGEIDITDDLATEDIPADILFPVKRAYEGISALINEVFQGKESIRLFEHRVECAETLIAEAPYGTADVIAQCGDHVLIVDYKNRFSDREHLHQLAAYAAFYQCAHPEVTDATLAVWYGDEGSYSVDHLSIEECRSIAIEACDNRRNRVGKPCKASAYCNICKHCGKCEESTALCSKAITVIPNDFAVVKPEQMSSLLTICSELEKRIKAIKTACKDYAMIHGGIADADGNLAYTISETNRSTINVLDFVAETEGILSPKDVVSTLTLPKETASELLKGKMTAKEIKALLKRVSATSATSYTLKRVK